MQNHSKAKTALLGRLSELKSKPTQNRRLPKVGNSDTITVPTHSNIYGYSFLSMPLYTQLHTLVSSQ